MPRNDLYQEKLLDYYHHPRNKGLLPHPDLTSGVYNPSCGDSVMMQAQLKNDILEKIVFEGKGCVISQAAASLLTERAQGLSLNEVESLTPSDMKKLVGIELGPTRVRCALLALEALQSAIGDYKKSRGG